MNVTTELARRSCRSAEGGQPMPDATADLLLAQLADWQREGTTLVKTFSFGNYYETTAFVNATAWIAHRQDHHPDITLGYNRCTIRFSTHAVGGLSENDFICAAKIDALATL